ncbi:MAG: hypothetical protein AAGA56_09960, partial [Myxococcota bacterium]
MGNEGGGVPTDCEELTSADIEGDVTLPEGCYDVPQSLVKNDGTVTIEPGATFFFGQGAVFSATSGRINAEGTEERPIVFTSREESSGAWGGIVFTTSRSADNLFDHVEVRYAGGSPSTGAVLVSADSQIEIRNSLFENNDQVGLSVPDGTSEIVVSDTTFRSNARSIGVHVANAGSLADLTLENNAAGHIA